jgi:hypothetical protein
MSPPAPKKYASKPAALRIFVAKPMRGVSAYTIAMPTHYFRNST